MSNDGDFDFVFGTKDSEDDNMYDMRHSNRGIAVIINNHQFQPGLSKPDRPGSDTDAAQLYKRFKALSFMVELHHNMKARDMTRLFHRVGQMDHSAADCFMCAILTHGEEDGSLFGTDNHVYLDDLVAPLTGDSCQSLAGKPKLFFIQASRGEKLDRGAEVVSQTTRREEFDAVPFEDDNEVQIAHRIPAQADFLMAFSTVAGYAAWSNTKKGSWFVQALCKVLEMYSHKEDLVKMLTRVNRMVAYEFESKSPVKSRSKLKQIPSFLSTLTKDLYFFSK